MVVKSLSDLWAERCSDASNMAGEFELMFRYVQRVLVNDLGGQGFETPTWAKADTELTMGLDPLPLTSDRRSGRGVAFTHLVNMVWQPVLRHMGGELPLDRTCGQEPRGHRRGDERHWGQTGRAFAR